MTLYAAFFREGNFRFPMSKFLGSVLKSYGIHISQVNALGLPRVFHFMFICRAQKSEGVLWVAVSIAFTDELWYKTLTWRPTPIIQLDEKALVAAGMSLLWVPRDSRAYPVYTHKGKGMAMAAFPAGEPVWTARIRDNSLHPTNESMSAYANVVLGVVEADTDVDRVPTREELINLSSEESTALSHGLTHRSSRVGPHQRPFQEPAGDDVSTPDVVYLTTAAEQKEARRKKHGEKRTKKEKTAERLASSSTRKHPSTVELLDDVVVSNTLSGLDARVKRSTLDPDDTVTLTEMMAKIQKILTDKKRELDE
ncbi:hypothetical protein Hanom_Chr04g00319961 [Helianthus anomalus]